MTEEFPFEIELTVRYRDMDSNAHVNNSVFSTYLEQARIEYFSHVLDMSFDEWQMVLADLHVDFRRPVTFEDEYVRIECGAVDIGNSSIELENRVYAGEAEEPAAVGEVVLVIVDEDGPRRIPDEWRAAFREFEPGL